MLLLHFVALFFEGAHFEWVQAICQQCFLVRAALLHCLHPVSDIPYSHFFSDVLLFAFLK